jgi:hypothetical protein
MDSVLKQQLEFLKIADELKKSNGKPCWLINPEGKTWQSIHGILRVWHLRYMNKQKLMV